MFRCRRDNVKRWFVLGGVLLGVGFAVIFLLCIAGGESACPGGGVFDFLILDVDPGGDANEEARRQAEMDAEATGGGRRLRVSADWA
jgi:hypothetical protein